MALSVVLDHETSLANDNRRVTVTCIECQKELCDPFILSCSHPCCDTCIAKLSEVIVSDEKGISCPVCGRFTPLDGKQSREFVLKCLQQYIQNTKVKDCEHCYKEEVKWQCIECKQCMCDNCQSIHLRVDATKEHPVKQYVSRFAFVLCKVHNEEILQYFCMTCKLSICDYCKNTGHKNHDIETNEAIARVISKNVEESRNTEKIIDYEKVYQGMKCKFEEKQRQAMGVANCYGDLLTALKDRFEKKEDLDSIIDPDSLSSTLEPMVTELKSKYIHDLDVKLQTETHSDKILPAKTVSSELCSTSIQTDKSDTNGKMNEKSQQTDECIGSKTEKRLWMNWRCMAKYMAILSIIVGFVTHNVQIGRLLNVNVPPKTQDTPATRPIDEVLSESSCNVEFSRQIDVQLSTLMTQLQTTKAVDTLIFEGVAWRFSIIDCQLWIPYIWLNLIHVLNLDGSEVRNITFPGYKDILPVSVIQMNENDVIMASWTGIYVLNIMGQIKYKIVDNLVTDVSKYGDKFLAINSQMKTMMQFNHRDNKWQLLSEHVLGVEYDLNMNFIQIVNHNKERYIYVTVEQYKTVLKYDHNWNLLQTIGKSSIRDLSAGIICGSDTQGSVLICGVDNSRFQIHTSEGILDDFTLEGVTQPVDLLKIGNIVYILGSDNGNYAKLYKYIINENN